MPSHSSKKRKRDHHESSQGPDTTKPSAIFQAPGEGRGYTLSIALPGSIIANAQTHDLKTALAGQIARAASVFCVDEIVIFNDGQSQPQHPQSRKSNWEDADDGSYDEHTGWSDPDHFLYHLLSYLECPPHLRRKLFPMHPNLKTAGALPSVDMPHHLRSHEWCEYREGVTLRSKSGDESTPVDAGLPNPINIDVSIPEGTRVTLKLSKNPPDHNGKIGAVPASPATPREEAGFYWGYSLRQASSLSAVFTESPFEDGYDVSIGTSERGKHVEDVLPLHLVAPSLNQKSEDSTRLPEAYSHLLIVFGGVAGLEVAAAADPELETTNVSELFDAWVNICPGQGSRTIRTEEAVWLGLAAFKTYVEKAGQ